MRQDLQGAFRSYEVRSSFQHPCRPLTAQKYLEVKPDAEAQFMVGLFHATGLGGVEEDQGKVSPTSSKSNVALAHTRRCFITPSPLCRTIDRPRWRWGTAIGQVSASKRYVRSWFYIQGLTGRTA
jgi:hypothetical protein